MVLPVPNGNGYMVAIVGDNGFGSVRKCEVAVALEARGYMVRLSSPISNI